MVIGKALYKLFINSWIHRESPQAWHAWISSSTAYLRLREYSRKACGPYVTVGRTHPTHPNSAAKALPTEWTLGPQLTKGWVRTHSLNITKSTACNNKNINILHGI